MGGDEYRGSKWWVVVTKIILLGVAGKVCSILEFFCLIGWTQFSL